MGRCERHDAKKCEFGCRLGYKVFHSSQVVWHGGGWKSQSQNRQGGRVPVPESPGGLPGRFGPERGGPTPLVFRALVLGSWRLMPPGRGPGRSGSHWGGQTPLVSGLTVLGMWPGS